MPEDVPKAFGSMVPEAGEKVGEARSEKERTRGDLHEQNLQVVEVHRQSAGC